MATPKTRGKIKSPTVTKAKKQLDIVRRKKIQFKLKIKNNYNYNYSHPYHIVNYSPWPLMVSFSLLLILLSLVLFFHFKQKANLIFWSGMILFFIAVLSWLYEVNNEGCYRGEHTDKVKALLIFGFLLFILSETSLFIGLFLSLFYNALAPSADIGCNWPPLGLHILNPIATPLLNTAVLFSSGVTITILQNKLAKKYMDTGIAYLAMTIVYGLIFTYLQYIEYSLASFSITDSIYGTTFYLLTGFHGVHVLLGTFLLILSLVKYANYVVTYLNPVFITVSSLYWHFVDYVWMALYIIIYCWII